ncbi:amidophosphoribosyltransferase-like [Antedon mediterranea]|uniref:amidophosphoribosyltransferase-like n=1 Tax=Antedon mediterranea TaxID=105859 RepID=UPI003AF53CD8
MASSSLEPYEDDFRLEEACGVFGCVAAGDWPTQLDVAHIIHLGLIGLQHRGQESAGIITYNSENKEFRKHKGMGMVNSIFKFDTLHRIKGEAGIGHTRYSTAGSSSLINCQPFDVDTIHGRIAVAHNGELVNKNSLRLKVLEHGVGLSTGSDSEVITQLLTSSPPEGEPNGPNWPARIRQVMKQTPTAYSLLIMHGSSMYAVRDPYGNRPLCIGQLINAASAGAKDPEVEGWVVSSESCCFQSVGARYYREVAAGEIVQLSKNGVESMSIVPRLDEAPPAFCIFEYVYFSRSDTIHEGQMVYSVRRRCGKQLAIEAPIEGDIVSTVPESATPAAIGYAQEIGIPYTEVLCKNRYVGRTFIQPSNRLRQLGVAKKFGPLVDNFKDKRIIIIDDSVVRGNTIGPIIKMLKAAGAKEVHIRVASPPVKHPCYMGINIPTREELIANKMDLEHLAKHFGADSIKYLSVKGLLSAVMEGISKNEKEFKKTNSKSRHCTACLTGDYPVSLDW